MGLLCALASKILPKARSRGAGQAHHSSAAASVPSRAARMDLNPGDDAPPGTPGTGEGLCPTCSGSGRHDNMACPDCGGTGHIVQAIGGA